MKLSKKTLTGVSITTLCIVLSACSSKQAATLPEINVIETSREFDNGAYQAALSAAQLQDSTDDQSVTGWSQSSTPVREFDFTAYIHDLEARRALARANDPVVQAGSSFSYGSFMTEMRSVLAQQKSSTAILSSSSSSRRSYTGLFGSRGDSVSSRSVRTSSSPSFTATTTAPSFNTYGSSSSSSAVRSQSSSTNAVAECGDGRDNDNDGRTDAEDGNCHTNGTPDQLSTYDYRMTSESVPGSAVRPAAADPELYSRGDCDDNSIVPILSSHATTGDEGQLFPYLFNGGCPIAGAILPGIGGNQTVFGSMDF